MRFLAFALCVSSVSPAFAEETLCLADPDRECLFALALDRAQAQEKLEDKAGDMIAIAAEKERAGVDDAGATVALVMGLLAAPEMDDKKRIATLTSGTLGADLVGATEVAAGLAEAVSQMHSDDPMLQTKLELRLLAYAGQREALRQRIAATNLTARADVALSAADALMQAKDFVAAFAVADSVDGDDFRAKLDNTAVIMLLRQDQIEAARIAAAMTADPATRTMSLMRVAKALAERGQKVAATALIAGVEASVQNDEPASFLPFAKAEVLARLGQREAAMTALAQSPEGLIQPRRRSEVEAVAALVAGDGEAFLAIVATADRPAEGGFWVKSAVLAALQAGIEDLEPLFAQIGPEQLPYALNALGLHQARSGDASAALATLSRLKGLGDIGRVHGDFRAALALLLVQGGDVTGGVALAAEGSDPRLIAKIAGGLPD